jgi:predicted dehydrogenase
VADLGLAVVGVGIHGSRYAEHLLAGDVPGARLAGVCRRSKEDAGLWTTRGVRFETDCAALVEAPGVDAVIVASPPASHAEHAGIVLSRGKPLILEKPVAPDLEACARIRKAAEEAAVPVLVGHAFRYHPVCRGFREELRTKGPVRWLALSQRHERMPIPWHFRGPGSGALLSVGVHMADLVRWILGEDPGTPLGGILDGDPGEAEGTAAVLSRTASGTVVSLEMSIVSSARRGFLEARCDSLVLEGDYRIHELSRREGWTRVPIPVAPPAPGLVPFMADFVRLVRGAGPGLAASLEDGIAAVAWVEECRRVLGAPGRPAPRHSPR